MYKPNYYRLFRDVWEPIRDTLPPSQGAKLLYAMVKLFFDDVEPKPGTLPKAAQAMFDIQRTSIRNYRRNALNGAKNAPKISQEAREEPNRKPGSEFELEADMEIDDGLHAGTDTLPASFMVLGTHPDVDPGHDPAPALGLTVGTNNNNQETTTNNQPSGTGGAFSTPRPARAVSETHKRTASTDNVAVTEDIPSFEEWTSLSERLRAAGNAYRDALTENELRRYRSGYRAYRQGRLKA